jgi:hypothetical protein
VSPVVFWSIISGLILILIYTILGIFNKKSMPSLEDIIQVFLGAVGFFGAIRLMGLVLSGQFSTLLKQTTKNSVLSFSEEDVVLIMIGGLAVAWVSLQTIIASYKKII